MASYLWTTISREIKVPGFCTGDYAPLEQHTSLEAMRWPEHDELGVECSALGRSFTMNEEVCPWI